MKQEIPDTDKFVKCLSKYQKNYVFLHFKSYSQKSFNYENN